jgi:hypothetical protein
VYKWSASKKKADPLDHIDLKGMKPEGLMQIPGTKKWHLLSDDDDVCSDEKDPSPLEDFGASSSTSTAITGVDLSNEHGRRILRL